LVRDPYQVLGIHRGATQAEIKAAFRRLAVQHHPDKNQSDSAAQARFTEINRAYQILGEPEQRARYDRHGQAAFVPGNSVGSEFFSFAGLEAVFGDILGALGLRRGDHGDIHQHLRLSFRDAALGCVPGAGRSTGQSHRNLHRV
jgi:molecular chaperone DnaJ